MYLRSLKQIVKGTRWRTAKRIFGPANGAIWWQNSRQITVHYKGSGYVIAVVVFQDGLWMKRNLLCEPLYEGKSYYEKKKNKVYDK